MPSRYRARADQRRSCLRATEGGDSDRWVLRDPARPHLQRGRSHHPWAAFWGDVIGETILLEAAQNHTISARLLGESALLEMQRRYFMKTAELRPRVYIRLTDDWIELTVRFIAMDHAIRELKDAMSRDILASLRAAGIGVASSTLELVGMPIADRAPSEGTRAHRSAHRGADLG